MTHESAGRDHDPEPSGSPGHEFRSPSDDFPAAPRFSLVAPASWHTSSSTDAALLVYDTDSPAHYRTNVLVTVHRVPRDVALTDVVGNLAHDAATDYSDYRVLAAHTTQVAGMPAEVRLHTFTPERSPGAVFGLQALFFAPDGGELPVHDLVQLQATCAGDQARRYAPAFEEVLRSFRFLGADE